jgi:hypothetical protein
MGDRSMSANKKVRERPCFLASSLSIFSECFYQLENAAFSGSGKNVKAERRFSSSFCVSNWTANSTKITGL